MELVVDASVVAKWFLAEEKRRKAEALRKNHLEKKIKLAVPALLFFELANLLITKKAVSPMKAKKGLATLLEMKIGFFLFEEADLGFWMNQARKRNISAYDASYIALAKRLNCEFITADKKLYEKVKTLKFVKFLD